MGTWSVHTFVRYSYNPFMRKSKNCHYSPLYVALNPLVPIVWDHIVRDDRKRGTYNATQRSLCIRPDAGHVWTIFTPTQHHTSPIVCFHLHPCASVSVHASACPSMHPCACMSVLSPVCASVHPSVRPYMHLRARPCARMSIHVPAGQYVRVAVIVNDKYTVVHTAVFIWLLQSRMAGAFGVIFITCLYAETSGVYICM